MILLAEFEGSQKGNREREVEGLQRRGEDERFQGERGEGEVGCGSRGDAQLRDRA